MIKMIAGGLSISESEVGFDIKSTKTRKINTDGKSDKVMLMISPAIATDPVATKMMEAQMATTEGSQRLLSSFLRIISEYYSRHCNVLCLSP